MRALDDARCETTCAATSPTRATRASASAREYAESLTQTVDVLLARLDETERSVQRARDEARRGSARLETRSNKRW